MNGHDYKRRKQLAYSSYGGNHRALCVYCGCPAFTIDHVMPISRGGTWDLANLVPSCKDCNGLKGSAKPLEFFVAHPWRAMHFACSALYACPSLRELAAHLAIVRPRHPS